MLHSLQMRLIPTPEIITAAVALVEQACRRLPQSIATRLTELEQYETHDGARAALKQINHNTVLAATENMPLCQDTGTAIWFVELGHKAMLAAPLEEILNTATAQAYTQHKLRASQVGDPLFARRNTGDNTPAIVHLHHCAGDQLQLTFLPKGGGADNKSAVAMLRPADSAAGVREFVLDTCRNAGGSSCPPWLLGIGIGGSFDTVAGLAKQALISAAPLDICDETTRADYTTLAAELHAAVNALGIGAIGFGGSESILGVRIKTAPCHIASLPVAVNLQCHSARSASIVL